MTSAVGSQKSRQKEQNQLISVCDQKGGQFCGRHLWKPPNCFAEASRGRTAAPRRLSNSFSVVGHSFRFCAAPNSNVPIFTVCEARRSIPYRYVFCWRFWSQCQLSNAGRMWAECGQNYLLWALGFLRHLAARIRIMKEIIEISQPAPSSCQERIMNGPIGAVHRDKE